MRFIKKISKKRFPALLLSALLAASLLLTGCTGGGDGYETDTAALAASSTGADLEGVSKEQPYARVLALSRSIGELWLLAGGELAGITEDGLDLDGIGHAVSIGTITKPSEEAVIALNPDLVLYSGELSSHQELAGKLEKMGIPALSITVDSFRDYADIMGSLTEMTGHPERYAENVEAVSKKIEQVIGKIPTTSDEESEMAWNGESEMASNGESEMASNPDSKNSYLAIRVSATKNKALKNDYFACAIFNDLQLTNVVEDSGELDDLNLEAIAAADPDYIFVVLQGEEEEAKTSLRDAFADKPVWKELSAVKDGKFFILPKDLFQYKPNARWAEAYEYVFQLIYGET